MRSVADKYIAHILSGNVLNNAGAPLPSSDDNRRVSPRRRDFLPTVYQNNGGWRRLGGEGNDNTRPNPGDSAVRQPIKTPPVGGAYRSFGLQKLQGMAPSAAGQHPTRFSITFVPVVIGQLGNHDTTAGGGVNELVVA